MVDARTQKNPPELAGVSAAPPLPNCGENGNPYQAASAEAVAAKIPSRWSGNRAALDHPRAFRFSLVSERPKRDASDMPSNAKRPPLQSFRDVRLVMKAARKEVLAVLWGGLASQSRIAARVCSVISN